MELSSSALRVLTPSFKANLPVFVIVVKDLLIDWRAEDNVGSGYRLNGWSLTLLVRVIAKRSTTHGWRLRKGPRRSTANCAMPGSH